MIKKLLVLVLLLFSVFSGYSQDCKECNYTGILTGNPYVEYVMVDSICPTLWYANLISSNTDACALPIELVVFDCSVDGDIYLYWTTTSEINNDYFIVEHSLDTYTWNEIDIVIGSGNSNVMNTYTTTHIEAYNGTNYYRLKQVDYDGNSEYFGIISCLIKDNISLTSINYYNMLYQKIDKVPYGYYIEVRTYSDGTVIRTKKFKLR